MTGDMARARQPLSNLELSARLQLPLPKAASFATNSTYATHFSIRIAEVPVPLARRQDEARQVSSPSQPGTSCFSPPSSAPFVLNQLSQASRADGAKPRG